MCQNILLSNPLTKPNSLCGCSWACEIVNAIGNGGGEQASENKTNRLGPTSFRMDHNGSIDPMIRIRQRQHLARVSASRDHLRIGCLFLFMQFCHAVRIGLKGYRL